MLSQPCEAIWTVVASGFDACVGDICGRQRSRYRCLSRWIKRSELFRLPRTGVHSAIAWAMTGRADGEIVWPPGRVSYMADVNWQAPAHVIMADPVHLETGADRLTLFPAACAAMKEDEAKALVATINDAFEHHDIQCVIGDSGRWYMTLQQSPNCDWIAPECAEGRDVLAFMPRGADGAIISRLINDVQMVLHGHPLNEARRSRGEPEINSIWPWGWRTDSLRPCPKWMGETIADHPYAIGLAMLSDSQPRVVTPADIEKPGGRGLIVFDDVETALRSQQENAVDKALARLEKQIVRPLIFALRRGSLDCIQIVTTSGCCYSVRRADLWKFWRRRSGLARVKT